MKHSSFAEIPYKRYRTLKFLQRHMSAHCCGTRYKFARFAFLPWLLPSKCLPGRALSPKGRNWYIVLQSHLGPEHIVPILAHSSHMANLRGGVFSLLCGAQTTTTTQDPLVQLWLASCINVDERRAVENATNRFTFVPSGK